MVSETSMAAVGGERVKLHVIQTAEGPRQFHGWLITPETTERRDSVRWTDFELYATSDSTYVLVVQGRSLRYHRDGSDCNQGVPMTAAEMDLHADKIDRDLVPCPRCKPGDYLEALAVSEDTPFNMEIDLPQVTVCRSPRAVISELMDENGKLSYPARKLLEKAARKDPGIARERSEVKPL